MKKLLLITAIAFLLFSCSNDSDSTNEPTQEVKNYNNLTFLDATYEKLNVDGNQLPVSVGDAVTIFERTTDIQITSTTFETNTIAPVAYYKSGFTYSLPSLTQFIFYEDSRIIIKKIEYPTSYGKDKRSERYSY
jgi:hypothetical protein